MTTKMEHHLKGGVGGLRSIELHAFSFNSHPKKVKTG